MTTNLEGRLGVLLGVREVLHVAWPVTWPYRFFDERAAELGPYYVSFGRDGALGEIASLQFGLQQHARWKRGGDQGARERFLAQAEWAAGAQTEIDGVPGFYACLCATAQGEAISLLLRAYQETGNGRFLDRAIDAAAPLSGPLRHGGPSQVLTGWICSLWALLELSRTANLRHTAEAYRQSLAMLERDLPRYDSGTWSYDSLPSIPAGRRRTATVQRHQMHVAQLMVLLSMTDLERFAVIAERWRRYSDSFSGRLQAKVNQLFPDLVLLDPLTVPSGAKRDLIGAIPGI
jgi:hypothetical protein